ncbi:MAG: hypothetical protein RLZZ324_869 [Candidatus Parcubacteria bacterium]|jgi:tRNA nucleotidyltransferase/poly(A) polymerase
MPEMRYTIPMHSSHDAVAFRLSALLDREPLLAFLRERPADSHEEWYVVGGAVRDAAIGRETSRDYDLLVRGVSLDALTERLSALGEVNFVGKRFGVLKFRPRGADREVDIAWPRTERAGGSGGYRDFSVQSDPMLPVEKDLARRDFTMNAIAWDVRKGTFIDPYGGLADIDDKLIRAVGEPGERFREDLSRMLRAIRFSCELGFRIDEPAWAELCRLAHRINDTRMADAAHVAMEDGEAEMERLVPQETVAREFVKAMLADPARATDLLEESGMLFQLIPELMPLPSCAQPSDHHSEGDVWTHTKLALAELHGPKVATLLHEDKPDAVTAIALLLHDIAKPQTAAPGPLGRTTFYGHAEAGADMARHVAARLRLSSAGVDEQRVEWLVKMHLVPNMLRVDEVRKTTLEKHFLRDREAGRQLLRLAASDAAASVRADGASSLTNMSELLEALAALERRGAAPGAARALLTGEEVMEVTGFGAGPQIGQLLESLREAQLNGKVNTHEDAKTFLRNAHLGEG